VGTESIKKKKNIPLEGGGGEKAESRGKRVRETRKRWSAGTRELSLEGGPKAIRSTTRREKEREKKGRGRLEEHRNHLFWLDSPSETFGLGEAKGKR